MGRLCLRAKVFISKSGIRTTYCFFLLMSSSSLSLIQLFLFLLLPRYIKRKKEERSNMLKRSVGKRKNLKREMFLRQVTSFLLFLLITFFFCYSFPFRYFFLFLHLYHSLQDKNASIMFQEA